MNLVSILCATLIIISGNMGEWVGLDRVEN